MLAGRSTATSISLRGVAQSGRVTLPFPAGLSWSFSNLLSLRRGVEKGKKKRLGLIKSLRQPALSLYSPTSPPPHLLLKFTRPSDEISRPCFSSAPSATPAGFLLYCGSLRTAYFQPYRPSCRRLSRRMSRPSALARPILPPVTPCVPSRPDERRPK